MIRDEVVQHLIVNLDRYGRCHELVVVAYTENAIRFRKIVNRSLQVLKTYRESIFLCYAANRNEFINVGQ
jgi:hypothetical protein